MVMSKKHFFVTSALGTLLAQTAVRRTTRTNEDATHDAMLARRKDVALCKLCIINALLCISQLESLLNFNNRNVVPERTQMRHPAVTTQRELVGQL